MDAFADDAPPSTENAVDAYDGDLYNDGQYNDGQYDSGPAPQRPQATPVRAAAAVNPADLDPAWEEDDLVRLTYGYGLNELN